MIGWHSLAKIRRSPEFDPPQGHLFLAPVVVFLSTKVPILGDFGYPAMYTFG